jgi:hypothetical protein
MRYLEIETCDDCIFEEMAGVPDNPVHWCFKANGWLANFPEIPDNCPLPNALPKEMK